MIRSPESSNFSPEPKETGPREQQILDTISAIEVPFMNSLQRAYGKERGWRICGPASIALSRVLSSLTGVPIHKGGLDEHIELALGIFDPKDDARRTERIEEQTYVRYYNGLGSVYYIDPIYGLLMEGKEEMAGAIQVEKYRVDEIDQSLITQHNLYPFDPNHDGLEFHPNFGKRTPTERFVIYRDAMSSLHDERATMASSITDSGALFATEWNKTIPVIQEFAPDWEQDNEATLMRLKEALTLLRGGGGKYLFEPPEAKMISRLGRTSAPRLISPRFTERTGSILDCEGAKKVTLFEKEEITPEAFSYERSRIQDIH